MEPVTFPAVRVSLPIPRETSPVESAPAELPASAEVEPVIQESEKEDVLTSPVLPQEETVDPGPSPVPEPLVPTLAGNTPVSAEVEKQGQRESYSPVNSASLLPKESADTGFSGTKLENLNLEGARMPAPSYPSKARRLEWEGDVTVSFMINNKGRVESINVEDSSGYDLLDETVIKTVQKAWRFPKQEEAVRVWKTFSFRLIS